MSTSRLMLSVVFLIVSSHVSVTAPAHGSVPVLRATPALGQSVGEWVTVVMDLGECPSGWDARDAGYHVAFDVTGANSASGEARVDEYGLATWAYQGVSPGVDVVRATVRFDPTPQHCGVGIAESAALEHQWYRLSARGLVAEITKSSGNPKGGLAVFECDAVGEPAIRVRIGSCTAGPVAAPGVTVEGPAAVTGGVLSTSEAIDYQVCWSATATFSTGHQRTVAGCDTGS